MFYLVYYAVDSQRTRVELTEEEPYQNMLKYEVFTDKRLAAFRLLFLIAHTYYASLADVILASRALPSSDVQQWHESYELHYCMLQIEETVPLYVGNDPEMFFTSSKGLHCQLKHIA